MIEGAIFLFLALTGLRYAVARLIPEPVRDATPAAIGAFLAHLGLQTANGLGLVVSDVATAVTIGGCPLEKRTYMTSLTDACKENIFACVTSDAYTCDDNGGIMTSATTWLGIGGLMLILIFMAYKYVPMMQWTPCLNATTQSSFLFSISRVVQAAICVHCWHCSCYSNQLVPWHRSDLLS